MGEFADRMLRDLEIRGYSKKTCDAYLRAMRELVRFCKRRPDELSCDDVNRFQHHLIRERQLSYSTVNIAVSAIRFFYTHSVTVPWSVNRIPYRKKPRKLPEILSRDEVSRLLASAENLKHRAILATIYAGGLRLGEVIRLRVDDIDSGRNLIRIRSGKGQKDRYVPLSQKLLLLLREYWFMERPKEWLFPGKIAGKPLYERTVQRMMEMACKRADLGKKVTVHSLRHAFATHSLEDGTHIRAVQAILGHTKLSTTTVYLHCTDEYVRDLGSPFDRLPGDKPGAAVIAGTG